MSKLQVLLPLDGSAEADLAVGVVAGLSPAKVTLLHAADGSEVPGPYWDGAEQRLKASGVREVVRLTKSGAAAKVILETAPKSGAELIALSMHGRSGWDLLRLGSVAEQVLRAATLPVLAVPKGAAPGGLLSCVLAPQDGSELAEQGLGRLAKLFPDRKGALHLVGVVEAYAGPSKLGAGDVVSRFYQLQADELKARLSSVAGGKAQVHIDLGRPASKILDYAGLLKATLIAMSTHGRSGLTRWTLGSVTEQVLRASPVPVLVLR